MKQEKTEVDSLLNPDIDDAFRLLRPKDGAPHIVESFPEISGVSVPEVMAPLFDEDNPLSVGSIMPTNLKNRIKLVVHDNPELFLLDETGLYEALTKRDACPTATDNRLRLSFWGEYESACTTGRHMNISNVCAGTISTSYFVQRYVTTPEKLAWLLMPPVKYDVLVTEALSHGLMRLREMLDMPIHETDKHGNIKISPKLLEMKLKIVAMLDMRMKGAFVERKINVNVQRSVKEEVNRINMEELDAQLEKLEDKSGTGI